MSRPNMTKVTPWRAKKNEMYFAVDFYDCIDLFTEKRSKGDDAQYKSLNYFRSREQAEEYIKKKKIILEKIHIASPDNLKLISSSNKNDVLYLIAITEKLIRILKEKL